MGICLSKKKKKNTKSSSSPKPSPPPPPLPQEKTQTQTQTPKVVPKPVSEAKHVFLITPTKPKASQPKPEQNPTPENARRDGALVVEEPRFVPVRTSSCTKEEVESILIQCGRLSRSSSGKGTAETGVVIKKHSGSKRSFDFDSEKKEEEEEEEEWEKGGSSSRPSPRRREQSRERDGSRERGNGGVRRVSRSPGRRPEGSSNANSSSKQPSKMVSVPAREKSSNSIRRKATSPAAKRSMRPVSNENSSKRADHSPYRRNPMGEIDENCVKNVAVETQKGNRIEGIRKAPSSQSQSQKTKHERKGSGEFNVKTATKGVRAKEKHEIVETTDDNPQPVLTRTRSSRRGSRDFDHLLSFENPTSYTNLLLEDIHHQKTGFALPACVTKARSILNAVADLNSSSSDNGSSNGLTVRKQNDTFVESEVGIGDDLMVQPSLHKYIISVTDKLRLDLDPQESAGSNSFVGPPWAPNQEPNSVDSDAQWTSNTGDESGQRSGHSGIQHDPIVKGRKQRIGSVVSTSLTAATASSSKRREVGNNGPNRAGQTGLGSSGNFRRASSAPVTAGY